MNRDITKRPRNYHFYVRSLRASTSLLCAFVSILFVAGLVNAAVGSEPQPMIAVMYAVFLVPFLILTLRCTRIQVAVEGKTVVVRNIWRTRVFPVEDVSSFSMGFRHAKFPGSEGAGTIHLRSGREYSVIALSQQSMFARHPRSEVVEAIDVLNELVHRAGKPSSG